MDAQVPAATVQERYQRLTAVVEETTYAENQKLSGATVEVLVAEGEGRKDAATHRMSGRARDNRLVHFAPHIGRPNPVPQNTVPHNTVPHNTGAPRPGDIVTVTVTRGAPHYLLADDAPLAIRRTRAGDAWQAAAAAPANPKTPKAPEALASAAAPVLLGMPAPRPLPAM
jgi:tRNA-2-methylthio-N6-dimethylallyladenosine synthase